MQVTYAVPMQWLNAPAGGGKSAIMRTFAEMLVERSLLLATFFFFRSAGTRNTNEHLISTITFNICRAIPSIRTYVEKAIDLNPVVFKASIPTQIQTLIVNPLLSYFYDPNSPVICPFPRIILIDGLDECSGIEAQQEIIMVFSKLVKTFPIPLAVIIASRPEVHIRMKFEAQALKNISSPITLDDTLNPQEDIATFYMAEFDEIRMTHPMKSYLTAWPNDSVIVKLVHNASGQFIYAATVIKFVKSTRHNPAVRLQKVLGTIDRGNANPFEPLDLLYTTVFLNVDPEILPAALQVLGIIICPLNPAPTNPRVRTQSPVFLEFLLGFGSGHIQSLFLDLESLLTVTSDDSNIRIFHTSLSDFLFDKSRSGDLFIDKGFIYATIATCITRLLSTKLGNAIVFPLIFAERLMSLQVSGQQAEGSATHISLEDTSAWVPYAYKQIHHCLLNAHPTEDLRRSIVSCDMARLFQLSFMEPLNISALAPMFLDGVEQSVSGHYGLCSLAPNDSFLLVFTQHFPDATDLYEMKFKSFTTFFVPLLINYWRQPKIEDFRQFLTLLAIKLPQMKCDEVWTFAWGIFLAPVDKSLLPDFELTTNEHDSEREKARDILLKSVIRAMLRPDGLLSHPKGQAAWIDLTITMMNIFLTYHSGRSQLFKFQGEKKPILPLVLNCCPPDADLVATAERVRQSRLYHIYPSYAAAVNSYLKVCISCYASYLDVVVFKYILQRCRKILPPQQEEASEEEASEETSEEKKGFLGGLFCC